ncbi:MAG: hypothetical protein U0821_21310 [Chloroflexota bacterium]
MTTRAQLRTTIRSELNDGGATPLWPDTLLNEWILEGLRDYGRQVGLEKSQTISSVAGQASYTLAADVIQVKRVEHPAGCFRVPAAFAAGDAVPTVDLVGVTAPSAALTFEVWGGALVLSPAPDTAGQPIVVRYLGAYAEPASDASVLDVPPREEEALVFYVCRRALQWIGMDEAKRQRFERQRGADPTTAAAQYLNEYVALVRQRQGRVARRRLAVRG